MIRTGANERSALLFGPQVAPARRRDLAPDQLAGAGSDEGIAPCARKPAFGGRLVLYSSLRHFGDRLSAERKRCDRRGTDQGNKNLAAIECLLSEHLTHSSPPDLPSPSTVGT